MDLIKSGQKLNIYIQKQDKLVSITCVITDIKRDRLVLDLPPYFMRYIEYLGVGCKLTVKVFSKLGTIDFNTVVISSPLEDFFTIELDYNAMKLTPGHEIPVINDIERLRIYFNDEEFYGNTFEISTEYLKFACTTYFETDDDLKCELILPENYGIITFSGTIKYVDPVYPNEYKVVYSTMAEEDRQKLLYYMYLYSNSTDWEQ